MDTESKDKLRRNRVNIVERMRDVDGVLDGLREDKVITAEFYEKVMAINVRANKVREILDYIPGKTKGYTGLIKALYLTENDGVLTALGEPFEIKDYELGKSLNFMGVTSVPSDMRYDMKQNPRGKLLIIEVREFDASLNTRRGSQLDYVALNDLFVKLFFNVQHELNPTAELIRQRVKEYAADETHAKSDCSIVVVLSHGCDGRIYGKDGQSVSIEDDIIAPILTCRNLQDKPKVFLFQACRSAIKKNEGDTVDAQLLEEKDLKIKKPLTNDVLIAYATQTGEKAYRHAEKGSWFIQSISTILVENAHTQDLLSMITMANYLIKKTQESDDPKQIGLVESTLLRKVYFHPGYCV